MSRQEWIFFAGIARRWKKWIRIFFPTCVTNIFLFERRKKRKKGVEIIHRSSEKIKNTKALFSFIWWYFPSKFTKEGSINMKKILLNILCEAFFSFHLLTFPPPLRKNTGCDYYHWKTVQGCLAQWCSLLRLWTQYYKKILALNLILGWNWLVES